ncbi:MAG TPA: hypothetical protein VGO43_12810 [Pyrinomonadaceae bacterium]|jgi:uncharacterized membrane protein HdeD (DUF308 family)|nr:hypothetical protein [Pyrinomonadaceae bacterium]
MTVEQIFQFVAGVFGLVATYFAWTEPKSDYLFPVIVLAISSAFLAYRFHVKARIDAHSATDTRSD